MAKEKTGTEIPTPVSILWQNILLLPLFGTIDSRRAQEIMETMLEKIVETEAKTIILDILGVAMVDTAVANHLIKITKATRLMGCECVVSGISPVVAQTLIQLGVDLSEVVTKASLKDALEMAFENVGLEVREVSKKKGA